MLNGLNGLPEPIEISSAERQVKGEVAPLNHSMSL